MPGFAFSALFLCVLRALLSPLGGREAAAVRIFAGRIQPVLFHTHTHIFSSLLTLEERGTVALSKSLLSAGRLQALGVREDSTQRRGEEKDLM